MYLSFLYSFYYIVLLHLLLTFILKAHFLKYKFRNFTIKIIFQYVQIFFFFVLNFSIYLFFLTSVVCVVQIAS